MSSHERIMHGIRHDTCDNVHYHSLEEVWHLYLA